MSTVPCSNITDPNTCIHASGSYVVGLVSMSPCIWCTDYQNVTKCIDGYEYCVDCSLCQSFDSLEVWECPEAIEGVSWLFFFGGVCVFIWWFVFLRVAFAKSNHENSANAYKFLAICFFPASVLFLGVSLWAAITDDDFSAFIWWCCGLTLSVGPLLLLILLMLIPLVITALAAIHKYVSNPVSAAVLASFIFVIPALVLICIILILIELYLQRDFISFGAEFSIIALGVDWAMLVWEYQTKESKTKLAKFWCRITFQKYPLCNTDQKQNESQVEKDLNRNTDVHLIETNQISEQEEEQKTYPASQETSTDARIASTYSVMSEQSMPLITKVQEADHENEVHIQLSVIQLFLYAVWMIAWIAWAFGNEEKEPCFMNVATGGPITIGILKRFYFAWKGKDTLCCCCIGGFVLVSLLILSSLSCTCTGSHTYCGRFHLAVVLTVCGWAWINFVHHMVHRFLVKNAKEEQEQ